MRGKSQKVPPTPVVILHPSASFRQGLGSALDPDRFRLEETDDLDGWLASAMRKVVVVADGSEPRVLALRSPESTVVILISALDVDRYRRALAAGADGVAHLDSHPTTIAHVIGGAAAGEVILPAEVARQLAGRPRPAQLELSPEESGLLQRLSEGATVVQLADEFYLAERSVRRRLQNIYVRIGADGRAEALKRASQLGLVD